MPQHYKKGRKCLIEKDMKLAKEVIHGDHDLVEHEVQYLINRLASNYELKPNVVEFPSEDVLFVGDLHGDIQAAEGVLNEFNEMSPSAVVFLGDYADRGSAQIQTINLVISMAIEFPEQVIMLRGNHEAENLASRYGFRGEVRREYSDNLFRSYCELFKSLPMAAMNEERIFACHGGIPEDVSSISDLQKIDRHHANIHDKVLFQLVWNDPKPADFYFRPSMRGGGSKYFGRRAFDEFSKNLDIHTIIRAHEAFPSGFRRFFDGNLISVFSTAYGGRVNPKIGHLSTERTISPISHI
ncbi:MAG: metallophosphoesterase [Promethearchaeia archaeon]